MEEWMAPKQKPSLDEDGMPDKDNLEIMICFLEKAANVAFTHPDETYAEQWFDLADAALRGGFH